MKLIAITGTELRAALAELEKAESAGFVASISVFEPTYKNATWSDARFLDISEKGHPSDPRLDWGRDNYLTKRGFTFRDGVLFLPPHEFQECQESTCEREGHHCGECGHPQHGPEAQPEIR